MACALLTDERLFGTTRLLDPEPRYRRVRHRLGLDVVLRALAAVFACGQECPVGRKLGFGQDYTISVIYRTVRITDPCVLRLWQTTTIGWSHQTVNEGTVTPMPADTPTIVFVHGAWADASGWGASISALRDRGFAAMGFANPLRHLTGDASYLAALLGTISV